MSNYGIERVWNPMFQARRHLSRPVLVLVLLAMLLTPAARPIQTARSAAAEHGEAEIGEPQQEPEARDVPSPQPFPPVKPEPVEMSGWYQVFRTDYWDGWLRPYGLIQYGSYEISNLSEINGAAALVLRHTLTDVAYRVRVDDGNGQWRIGKTTGKQVAGGVTEEVVVFDGIPLTAPSYVALDVRPADSDAAPPHFPGRDIDFPRWSPDWNIPADAAYASVATRLVSIDGEAKRGARANGPFLMDLDDGRLLEFAARPELRHRLVVQLRHGFDLYLESQFFSVIALRYNAAVLEPAPPTAWDHFTPEELISHLAQFQLDTGVRLIDTSSPPGPFLGKASPLPADFLFKTREGGIGILRVQQPPRRAGKLAFFIRRVVRSEEPGEDD